MQTEQAILEQWFEQTIGTYSTESTGFLATTKDQFRNPVGHTLRENLTILLRQLLGDMDLALMQSALESIIRIRAVQDLTASQAAGFVFLLRPILREGMPENEAVLLNSRTDQLALMAFEEYVRCRERLADIRVRESRRAMQDASACSRSLRIL